MQHFTTWSASSTFVCGADAVGRRNSRLDVDPSLTDCAACKRTEAWTEAYIVWTAEHPVPTLLENLLDIYRDFLTAGNLEGAAETRRVILATFPQN
jgi:hypothetical protein